jgi:apolipoprotein N-acyltransferase
MWGAGMTKQFLLSFIEKPLIGMSVPFFSSKGFLVKDDTAHSAPLQTPYGKAGIMICNEAAVEKPARESVRKGAEFFCNMSNDGWFNSTYIVRSHFLSARLRAVETRKDVVVNCNNGFSGLINATGNIVEQQKDTEPFIQIEQIHPNNYESFATRFPALFVYVCAACVLLATARNVVKRGGRE